MSILRNKLNGLVECLYAIYIKLKNHNAKICIKTDKLNHVVSIKAGENSSVEIGRIWVGAGKVNIIAEPGAHLVIHDDVCINANCVIYACRDIEIGCDTMIGPNVVISDEMPQRVCNSNIKIGNAAWISANAVITNGAVIGNNCVIGAMTCVNNTVKDNMVVVNGGV